MERDDAQYVRELILGNHSAFEGLFMKYFPKVKCFITHLVKSEEVGEELAQDIFMKVWEYRERLGHVQSFNAYIYRMSRNIAFNYLEHKYVEEIYVEKQQGVSMSISPEDEMYAREIELLEQLTVNNMPPKRKEIYQMSRKRGLANEEIAKELNITKKTVENHLNLALKEIRKALSLFTSFFL